MTGVYGLILFSVALVTGFAAACQCASPARRVGTGLLAAAQVPLLLAMFAMATAWGFPGQTEAIRWLPVIGILTLAAVALRWRTPPTVSGDGPDHHRRFLPAALVAGGGTLLVLAKFLSILASNLFPVIANDALTYLAEARMFAASGSLSALMHGLGDPASGAPPTHPHTGLFSVYLGHALLFSPGPQLPGAP